MRSPAPALALVADWPVETAAVAVVGPEGATATTGPLDRRLPLASLTKLLTALAVLVAVEEESVALDLPAGPEGATVAHLLAHASGLAPDEPRVLAPPGTRRIYSNAGFERVADVVAERTGMPFAAYLHAAVLEPLGLRATVLEGSPAWGAVGTTGDLVALGRELLSPTIVAPATLASATEAFLPELAGVLPGFGPQDPNPWGLGFEIKGAKSPHWTAPEGSPRTFGHFGRAGGFLWVDPDAGVATCCLTDRDFGPWAAAAWPQLGQAVLDHAR